MRLADCPATPSMPAVTPTGRPKTMRLVVVLDQGQLTSETNKGGLLIDVSIISDSNVFSSLPPPTTLPLWLRPVLFSEESGHGRSLEHSYWTISGQNLCFLSQSPQVRLFSLLRLLGRTHSHFATVVTCITKLTSIDLGVNNQLLTVLGLVLGLVISFRTSSAYER